jgi:hypothetical protein
MIKNKPIKLHIPVPNHPGITQCVDLERVSITVGNQPEQSLGEFLNYLMNKVEDLENKVWILLDERIQK